MLNTVKNVKTKHLKNKKVIIGYFDIIHRGHEKLFKSNNDAVIVTFKNTPSKTNPINNFKIRVTNLKKYGFRKIYKFDISKNNMTANDFYNKYLKEAKIIVVGKDFRFGSDAIKIKSLNRSNVNLIEYDNKYSTTSIKQQLEKGNVSEVNKQLSQPFTIINKVVHGKKYGRKLGFPTINFVFSNELKLKHGVYLTKTEVNGRIFKSITMFGIPKTIKSDNLIVMETHIIGFEGNLYNKKVKVSFYKFINELIKFETQQELIDKILLYKNKALSTKY